MIHRCEVLSTACSGRPAGAFGHSFRRAIFWMQILLRTHACLILDVRLPGVSGLDLQGELIRKHVEVPVIFLSGHADIPMSVRAMKAGAIEFLTKPFDDEELLGAIRQAFEQDDASRQRQGDQQKELAAAARIQQGLMTMTAPQLPFAVAMGKNCPCKGVGGDFFSIVTQGDSLVAAIADVSGKGIAAAVMASLLQGMIHEGLLSKVPLPEIAHSPTNSFVYAIWAPSTRHS